ncbi:MAG: phospho-sugar mutase [Acholeplasmataceae bacterium]|jgi:phosphoglucomutase
MHPQATYELWKQYEDLDQDLKKELLSLTDDEIKERFTYPLEFGTGGLRDKMGVGISRLNIYTIAQAAKGFSMYLKKQFGTGSVVISYDNRMHSKTFAIESAKVMIHDGFDVHVFESLRPTPMLSYAVRHFKAVGGIMITASHNPKEDNGFKAYNHTGAQINLIEADAVIAEIKSITDIFGIPKGQASQIDWIHEDFDSIYLDDIASIRLHKDLFPTTISYSPLHGTGSTVIPRILRSHGFHVHEEINESVPDPLFTYTASSNPEQQKAFINGLALAKKTDSDVLFITDPDADRLGVAVKHQGTYELLTGNQTAALELFYILNERSQLGTLPKDGQVYTTIVTSDLIKNIANSYHLNVIETLTGFKFIGEQAELHTAPYVFGCEESYGSLISDKVRDKDAVQACLMLSEMVGYYKKQTLTLIDVLNQIYETYGYYVEITDNFFFEGIQGKETMKQLLDDLRIKPLEMPHLSLIDTRDYATGQGMKDGHAFALDLPRSNVLEYRYQEGFIILRPSGTEPKLKVYYGFHGNKQEEVTQLVSTSQSILKSVLKG